MLPFVAVSPTLPERPPFVLRARVVTPLAAGGTLDEPDGLVAVDANGRIATMRAASRDALDALAPHAAPSQHRREAGKSAAFTPSGPILDLRPWVVMPGMVDLHAHLPQFPNAGLGAGLHLLDWLERYVFPLERGFDAQTAERLAPAAFRALAAAGTTTAVLYGAVYAASLDASFRSAEAHGIRAVIGKVMMDRLRYDTLLPDAEVLDRSLEESAELCERWHGVDDGRLAYAFTPRFAVSCSPEMLRESARLAASTGAYWQTHLAEDRNELAAVAAAYPDALDYTDVYDRAGGLGERSIFAHAIYLTDREVARIATTGSRIAHCPASNLFLASGAMPLARYLDAGLMVGLGSDVAAGPDLSIFTQMRVGAYVQNAVTLMGERRPALDPPGWLRLATLDGARCLGIEDRIGSIETGKEADLIAIDADLTAPLLGVTDAMPTGGGSTEDEATHALLSRLMFRTHPDMVRAAWVRGRRLAGPGERDRRGGPSGPAGRREAA